MFEGAFPKTRALISVAFLAVALVSLSGEPAKANQIPPGFAVVDQYTEAFPGAGGDEKPPAGGDRNSGAGFPEKTANKFAQAGPAGISALNLAAAAAPERALDASSNRAGIDRPKTGSNGSKVSGSDPRLAAPVSGSEEVAKHMFGVADSEGMGVVLPLIMIATVLLGGLFVVRRKRFAA